MKYTFYKDAMQLALVLNCALGLDLGIVLYDEIVHSSLFNEDVVNENNL